MFTLNRFIEHQPDEDYLMQRYTGNTHSLFTEQNKVRQIERETTAYIEEGRANYAKRLEHKVGCDTAPAVEFIEKNHAKVARKIQESVDEIKNRTGKEAMKRKPAWFKLIKDLSPYLLAGHALREALSAGCASWNAERQEQDRINHKSGAYRLARVIEHDLQLTAFRKTHRWLYDYLAEETQDFVRVRGLLKAADNKEITGPQWTQNEQLDVGFHLYDCVCKATKLLENVVERVSKKKTIRYWQLTDGAIKRINEIHDIVAALMPVQRPMLVPPRDWSSFTEGGFITSGQRDGAYNHIRFIRKDFDDLCVAHLDWHKAKPVIESVNRGQRVAWRINRAVYDVLVALGAEKREKDEKGRPLTGRDEILPDQFVVPVTRHPKALGKRIKKGRATKADTIRYEELVNKRKDDLSKKNSIDQKARSMTHSMRIAGEFVDEAAFWFAMNLDFRGRVYHLSCVSPQGSRYDKGLLEFAEGVRLGDTPNGVFWLAVHLANSFGEDKLGFDQRVAWVMDHEDEILASAADPLAPDAFWRQADEKTRWQFLAACFDWAGYIIAGEDHVSHLPIYMDGVCNGQQHLIAQKLTLQGAHDVSLLAGDEPGKLYEKVDDAVSAILEDGDTEEAMAARVYWSPEHVTRKLVKRPTLATAYRVTDRGIHNMLVDEVQHITVKDVPEAKRLPEAKRIATAPMVPLMREGIGQVLGECLEILEYLVGVTRIMTSFGHQMTWTTPLGLKITQKECKSMPPKEGARQKVNNMGTPIHLRHTVPNKNKPALDKSLSGISANHTHSYDACHLQMIVNDLVERGVESMGLVHDSIAVHAAHVETLHHSIREQFINIYREDVLANLEQECIAKLTPEQARLITEDEELQALRARKYEWRIEDVRKSDYKWC
jgi:DNA-directed RNA polymerase